MPGHHSGTHIAENMHNSWDSAWVPRTISRGGRQTSVARAHRLGDRPLENSPLLEFVCSMWSPRSGWGASRRTTRAPSSFEISKWINFIDRAAFDRDARRDNINSLPTGRTGFGEFPMLLKRAAKYRRRGVAINVKLLLKSLSSVA